MTSDAPTPIALSGMFPEEIANALDLPLLRGKQIFHWIHKKQVFSLQKMTDLPKPFREHMAEHVVVLTTKPRVHQESRTASAVKVLLELGDGETIESVSLRHGPRATFCLSAQVGCALGCQFCATGMAGFRRNLQPNEIIEQVLYLLSTAPSSLVTKPNIVFMGMGEPFHNYDAVMKSIRLLMHPDGLGIGARKITISTVGDVPGILRFVNEPWQVRLSISLHSADDAIRSELVPMNRKYPLHELYEALRVYQRERKRQITVEWVLLRDINDKPEHAKKLASYLRGLDAVVNVIPWNAIPDLPFGVPEPAACGKFLRALEKAGLKCTIRKEHGADIDAACGQLRNLRRSCLS